MQVTEEANAEDRRKEGQRIIDEVFGHFGKSLEEYRDEGHEFDFYICKADVAGKNTADMCGFGLKQSQRIIIEYDKDYDKVLVRRENLYKPTVTLSEEKQSWLQSIGAKAFPEPVKYSYTFREYNGAFNLSEKYICEHSVEELQAAYEKCKQHAERVIASQKERDNQNRNAGQKKTDHEHQSTTELFRYQCEDIQGSRAPESL